MARQTGRPPTAAEMKVRLAEMAKRLKGDGRVVERLDALSDALRGNLAVVTADVGDAIRSTGEFSGLKVLYVVDDFRQLDDESFDTRAVLERLAEYPRRNFMVVVWDAPDRVQFAVLCLPDQLQDVCQHMLLYHDQMEGCQERLA